MLALMEYTDHPTVGNSSLLLCIAQEEGFLAPEGGLYVGCGEQPQAAVIPGGEASSC